jgi:diguanylate cyclase (GGDEF)-like protein/PAS domain S-box-containing protein
LLGGGTGWTWNQLHRIANWRFRTQLLVLVAAAMLPLAGVIVYGLLAHYDETQAQSREIVRILADKAADRISDNLKDSQRVLRSLAARPLVRAMTAGPCDQALAEAASLLTRFIGINLRSLNGDAVCSTTSATFASAAVAQAPWFKAGLASTGFHASGAIFGPRHTRWTAVLTQVVRDSDGEKAGLLVAPVDLMQLQELVLSGAPKDAVISVIDQNGRYLMRTADPARWVGTDARNPEVAEESWRQPLAFLQAHGPDGVARLYAATSVDWLGWRVMAGLPEDVVFAGNREQLALSVGVLLACLAAALALGRVIARRIEAPLRELERVARTASSAPEARGGSEVAAVARGLQRVVQSRDLSLEQLQESESRLRGIVESAMDAVVTIDERQRIVQFNPAAEAMFGYAERDIRGQPLERLLPERVREAHARHVREFGASGATGRRMGALGTLTGRRADGSEFPIEASISQQRLPGRRLYTAILRDVTDRVEAERRLRRQNDFYGALSQTNHAIVHARDAGLLMQEICRICVEHGHAKIAYIGLVEARRVAPAVWAGPAEEFLDGLSIPLDSAQPEGNGPIAELVRNGRPAIVNDFLADPRTLPWRERAARLGTRATAAFAFRRGGKVAGVLSLHVTEPGFFDPPLVALLEEMVNDLSFALDNLDRQVARLEAEQRRRAAMERFETIFNATPAATTISSLDDGTVLAVNDAACALYGYKREEMVGRTAQALEMWAGPQEREGFHRRVSAERRVSGHEVRLRRRSGELRDVQMSAELIDFLDQPCVLAISNDVTERKRYEARIEYLATHDGLTDLPNRNLMQDRIEQVISHARRVGRQVAVLYLDLDRFKVVNDGFGHPFGDALLKAAGERLRGVVRPGDTIARQSGDEFLILLADLRRPEDVFLVARKVLEAFEAPLTLDGREVHVSFSIGISVFPQDGETANALITNADVAMYRAKDLGGKTYQYFTREMSEETRQRVDLETQLQVALARNQMHLAYQPKVDLASGRIIGCEALLRWTHPELGAVSPARFIPAAEDSGLIVPIGDWVLRSACAQNKAWLDAGLAPVSVSVNLSVRQFLQQDVVAWVQDALRQSALPARQLELELTESLIAQNTEKVIATISQLKAMGVRLSIDDFGTGYSSLSYLKRFRVDTLKIDQSFIRHLLTERDDAAIAVAVVSLAHSLGMKAIAEGVETAEHCEFLRRHGCDEIQGYYFAKPVPAAEFEAMLRSGKRLQAVAAG